MKKTISEQILEKLAAVKVALAAAKFIPGAAPVDNTLKTKEGKDLKFKGELAENVEIALGDAAITDGTHELADGRKFSTKDGKFVKFEEVPAPTEVEQLRADLAAQVALNAELTTKHADLEARFGNIVASQETLLAAVASVADAIDAEDLGKGGNEGNPEGGLTKAEWVTLQAKKA